MPSGASAAAAAASATESASASAVRAESMLTCADGGCSSCTTCRGGCCGVYKGGLQAGKRCRLQREHRASVYRTVTRRGHAVYGTRRERAMGRALWGAPRPDWPGARRSRRSHTAKRNTWRRALHRPANSRRSGAPARCVAPASVRGRALHPAQSTARAGRAAGRAACAQQIGAAPALRGAWRVRRQAFCVEESRMMRGYLEHSLPACARRSLET